jgi:ribosomal protein S18 acetylase RimI-like enzyme
MPIDLQHSFCMTPFEHDRVVAFERAVIEGRASRVEDGPFGRAVFMDAFPSFYFGNLLQIDRLPSGAGADEVIAELDRVLAGYEHRLACTFDPEIGRSLTDGLASRGFDVEHSLQLVLRETPDRQPDAGIEVIDASPDQMDSLRRQGWLEEGFTEERLAPLVNRHHVAVPGIRARSYAARASDGTLVSGCDLYSDGTTAQVENVETLEAYRRQGFARAACSAAIETARREEHEVVFITAEAGSMPAAFYRTLGFESIGSEFAFTKFPD